MLDKIKLNPSREKVIYVTCQFPLKTRFWMSAWDLFSRLWLSLFSKWLQRVALIQTSSAFQLESPLSFFLFPPSVTTSSPPLTAMCNSIIIFSPLWLLYSLSLPTVYVCVSLASVLGAAAWCSAERLWRGSSTAAAGATVMMRRTTWCWECAWMLLDFPSRTARCSTRLCLQTSPNVSMCCFVSWRFYLLIHLFSL